MFDSMSWLRFHKPLLWTWAALAALLLPALPATAINIVLNFDSTDSESPTFDPTGTLLQSLFQHAEIFYEGVFQDTAANTTLTINYWYDDMATFSGKHDPVTQTTSGNTLPNRETEANIRIDTLVGTGGSERNWFIDTTPDDDQEYDMQQTLWRDLTAAQRTDFFNFGANIPDTFETGYTGSAVAGSAAVGARDMLSIVLHEVGHALGMSTRNNATVAETGDNDYDFNPDFVFGKTLAAEGADGGNNAHLDTDGLFLMDPAPAPSGTRWRPSHSDLFSMAAGHSYTSLDVPRREFYRPGGGGNWNNPTNWSGDEVPESGDDVYVRDNRPGAIGDLSTANLTANGNAANLTVSEGANVDTEGFRLDVVRTIMVTDTDSDLFIRNGGEAEAETLTVTNGAEVRPRTGGLIDVDQFNINSDSTLIGAGDVNVQTKLKNDGTIQTDGGLLALTSTSSKGVWDLDGSTGSGKVLVTGESLHVTGELTDPFDGEMTVGQMTFGQTLDSTGYIATFVDGWELGTGGDLTMYGDNDDQARISGGTFTVAGDVEVNGIGRFQANVTFESTADITLADADDALYLNGITTYDGGDYIGDGKLVQNGDAVINGDTTIDVATFDMDGTSGTSTVIISDATLTLNSSLIEGSGPINDYDGNLSVLAGSLVVNTDDDWRLDGTMTLIQGTVSGQHLTVANGGSLVANGTLSSSTIDAAVTFEVGSSTTVSTNCELDLTGEIIYSGGSFDGDGTLIQTSDAQVTEDTTISTATFDWDGRNGNSTTTIDAGATLTIDSKTIESISRGGFDGTLNLNSSEIVVNTTDAWSMAGTANMDTASGSPRISGSQIVLVDTLNATGGGDAHIDSDTIIKTTASLVVAADTKLSINGTTSLKGGSFSTGPATSTTPVSRVELDGFTNYDGGIIAVAGVLRQDGDASVNASTTIEGDHFDMDGSTGVNSDWTLDSDLTLNVQGIEDRTTNNEFNGTLNINNPGRLTVNTTDRSWTMAGTMNLDQNGHRNTYLVRGDDINMTGQMTVIGATAISASAHISGTVTLGDADDLLQLGGGGNTLSGGEIVGPGRLSAVGSVSNNSLTGHGTISADINFTGSDSDLLADGGTLSVSGEILDVDDIGTASSTGTLNMANAWNTDVADELRLNGGVVTGSGITNDGTTIGHGTITSSSFANNSTLTADGGTLIVDTSSYPDLDGTTDTGIVNALQGSVEVLPGHVSSFNFHGTLNVGAGHAFRSGARGLANSGVVNLTNAMVSATTLRYQGHLNVFSGGTSRLESPTIEFESGSISTIDDDLEVVGDTDIFAGAVLSGSGRLVVPDGSLLNLLDGATVDIDVQNNGQMSVGSLSGFSPGTMSFGGDVVLGFSSTTQIELAGAAAGEYDQLLVSNELEVSGALEVQLLDEFQPDTGDMFDILQFGTFSGEFSLVQLPDLLDGLSWDSSDLYSHGTLSVIRELAVLKGDVDDDGSVNNLDITPFIAALSAADEAAFLIAFPNGNYDAADIDMSGSPNNLDITPFIGLLTAASATAVPEPGSLACVVLALMMGRRRAARRGPTPMATPRWRAMRLDGCIRTSRYYALPPQYLP